MHNPAYATDCGDDRARRYRPYSGRRGSTQQGNFRFRSPGQQAPVALITSHAVLAADGAARRCLTRPQRPPKPQRSGLWERRRNHIGIRTLFGSVSFRAVSGGDAGVRTRSVSAKLWRRRGLRKQPSPPNPQGGSAPWTRLTSTIPPSDGMQTRRSPTAAWRMANPATRRAERERRRRRHRHHRRRATPLALAPRMPRAPCG